MASCIRYPASWATISLAHARASRSGPLCRRAWAVLRLLAGTSIALHTFFPEQRRFASVAVATGASCAATTRYLRGLGFTPVDTTARRSPTYVLLQGGATSTREHPIVHMAREAGELAPALLMLSAPLPASLCCGIVRTLSHGREPAHVSVRCDKAACGPPQSCPPEVPTHRWSAAPR